MPHDVFPDDVYMNFPYGAFPIPLVVHVFALAPDQFLLGQK